MGNQPSLVERQPGIPVPMMKSLKERKKVYKQAEKAMPAKSKKALKTVSDLLENVIKDVKDKQKMSGSGMCGEGGNIGEDIRRTFQPFTDVFRFGAGLPKRARGQMVSELMKKEGLTLGQASKKLASMNK